jgi:hypothetical protein
VQFFAFSGMKTVKLMSRLMFDISQAVRKAIIFTKKISQAVTTLVNKIFRISLIFHNHINGGDRDVQFFAIDPPPINL